MDRLSVVRAGEMLRAGAATPEGLLEEALARAREHSGLNAMATLDADEAAAQAAALGAELREGRRRGPLHGVPITVKDLFRVDGLECRAGARAPLPALPASEGTAVRRLRQAGAVIVGTTNMVEIALGITGENPWTGDVRNPYDPARQPGGSSSGAAVAVSTGIGLAALGTDTGGSIRIPAALCGIVGFKGSYGLVPMDGGLPLSATCDHAGPLTLTVRDAHAVMEVLAARPLPLSPVENVRVGLPAAYLAGRLGTSMREAFTRCLEDLKSTGATVVEVEPEVLDESLEIYNTVQLHEAATLHLDVLEVFSPRVRTALDQGLTISPKSYQAGQRDRARLRSALEKTLASVDALILPTTPVPAPLRGGTEVSLESGTLSQREAFLPLTAPFNLTGLPALTLPMDHMDGLPAGLQLVGAGGTDARLLSLATWFETFLTSRHPTT